MKKSRFSEEQMVKILRDADRNPIDEEAVGLQFCHGVMLDVSAGA